MSGNVFTMEGPQTPNSPFSRYRFTELTTRGTPRMRHRKRRLGSISIRSVCKFQTAPSCRKGNLRRVRVKRGSCQCGKEIFKRVQSMRCIKCFIQKINVCECDWIFIRIVVRHLNMCVLRTSYMFRSELQVY